MGLLGLASVWHHPEAQASDWFLADRNLSVLVAGVAMQKFEYTGTQV